ncbi:MAG: hypothetical protein ACREQ9_14695 [Candidatus Binatia bacterium]
MKRVRRARATGYGSVISIVVTLLIGFLLMVFYLREFVPSASRGTGQGTAIDAARKQARAFEEQQQKRLEEMNEAAK